MAVAALTSTLLTLAGCGDAGPGANVPAGPHRSAAEHSAHRRRFIGLPAVMNAMPKTLTLFINMNSTKLNYTSSWIFIIGLFLISLVVFWPRYYSRLFDVSFYLHLHAITAILWFALLVAQPLFIKKRKLKLHRLLGKLSYPVAAMIVISIILLTHNRISATPEEHFVRRSYIVYLQLSLAFVFAVTYGFAIWYRKTKDIHARLMVATVFTFIDPVFDRFISMFMPFITIRGEWFTFGFINLMLITLAMTDRNHPKARWVFPGLLLLYLIIEIPIFFQLTDRGWWQSFAA